MRIFFILILFGVFLFSETTTIERVNKKIITLKSDIQKGKTGIVLCPYEGKNIICASCVSLGKNKAKLEIYDNLKNRAFALPVVYPKVNNEVIFGKNYNRIMIIAPNQITYLKLKEKFKNLTIVPVDTFAAFLDDLPEKKDFLDFAKKMDIGLYIFALDKLYIVDSNSFYVINKEDLKLDNKKFKLPFYSSYNFDIEEKNIISYYKKMLKGLND